VWHELCRVLLQLSVDRRRDEVIYSRTVDDDLAAASNDDGQDDDLATGRRGFWVRIVRMVDELLVEQGMDDWPTDGEGFLQAMAPLFTHGGENSELKRLDESWRG
jgi:hypothetical protein